jgi:hypothetical protein
MTFESRLLKEPEERGMLAHTFAERMLLGKQTRAYAQEHAGLEWDAVDKWLQSESRRVGSFFWYCDEFDMDPGAVRRAVRESRKKVDGSLKS